MLSSYGMFNSCANIVGGERLGDPGCDTRSFGKKTVGSTIEKQNHRHVILAGEGGLLAQLPGDGHPPHAADLKIDHYSIRPFGLDAVSGRSRIFVIDQGVIGLGEGGVDFVTSPGFVCNDDNS